ncbi:kinesin-like protein KIF26A isoform X1 [Corythoichthys intestinalis]|uniref:kinesin-like protein KIF26A isoform X1 n=2 Tax=Corythoichthys intestinalis TaxID=161448 RepID=UPI0025A63FE5|nr:kinesin-like protein KIF26A isoform X1 [Corythoichthys intestinalis]
MALPNSTGSAGGGKPEPGIIDLGTIFVDSDIIFGFTSHLLKRKKKLEGCPTGESPATPRKRLLSAEDARCSSRPAPEGAGSVCVAELEEKGSFCHTCQKKVSELRKLALTLADPNSSKDTGYAAFLFEQLNTSGSKESAVTCCQVCFTPLHQLKQEALQTLHDPVLTLAPDMPALPASSFLPRPSRFVGSPSSIHANQLSKGQAGTQSILPTGEQLRGLCGSQGPPIPSSSKTSVQVTVAGGQLTGSLSAVTIQTQQYLEGVWSISRVNNFLPQLKSAQSLMGDADRDVTTSTATLTSSSSSSTKSSTLTPCRLRGSTQTGLPTPITSASSSVTPSSSAAASFFIRAAQKLNLSSKRKKQQPSLLHPQEPSIYPTNFSGILQVSPPAAPPCLLRAVSKVKENPGMGKVKVMMRICPSLEATDSSESQSFLKVDSRKKQVTLYDPASSPPHSSSAHRRSATVAVPKIFAFDAVFTQDASQAEVCSGTVAEVIQSVANGADGCIFCFGQAKLGKTNTMIGKDSSTQTIGVVPCAISWLFKLINERKEKTGARFSVRVSAVEIFGKEEELKDLLSEVSKGSQQEGQSPGIHLREDPICGTQLQNQSELHAPTAEKAAFFLDAAISARSTSQPNADEEERRNSHMLFTLHIYQYRMEKSGKGGMSGGRSRLHLIDLGSCEKILSKSREGGGGACLSLNALGNVIMALANGAKHVPYKDSKLTMLLRESLGNINCRTTMIAHISDSPANYADSLTTIQLASRIHRMRKKKSKYASSSSGGESSCEEGRIRRPPHLRPFHPRTVALDPDLPSLLSDPDYSSSSEQSCDTVIYVGPGGAAISDRELSDNEGPPAFVPIIPSINKKRTTKEGPLDRDQFFKCNTFAELQERLECIDGSEEPTAFVGEGKRHHANPKLDKSKESESSVSPKTVASMTCNQDSISPKLVAIEPFSSPGNKSKADILERRGTLAEMKQTECVVPNVCRTSADGERILVPENTVDAEKLPSAATIHPEPVVREKIYFNKKGSRKEISEKTARSNTRMPPVGMSHQAVKRRDPCASPILRAPMEVCQVSSTIQERCFDRDILRATVTLQQPVELNGEDELVFTVVEELSIGSIVDKGRPSSIISFNSDCSLQAIASGSRPVSIISSINDEFDAYTSSVERADLNIELAMPLQEGPLECVHSRGSSVSSWLSEVSVCTLESEGAQSSDVFLPPEKDIGTESTFNFDSLDMLHSVPSTRDTKNSLNDSGFSFSEQDSDSTASSKLSLTKCPPSPDSTKASLRLPSKITKAHSLSSTLSQSPSMVHSSLPRKVKPTSSIPSSSSSSNSRDLPRQENKQENPWQRTDNLPQAQPIVSTSRFVRTPQSGISSSKVSNNCNSAPRPSKLHGATSSQRVVDGCEKTACKKFDPPSRMPQLRRGATTLGTVPVIHSSTDYKGTQDVAAATGLKFSSLGKSNKANSQKSSNLPRPGCISPPPPPIRKSSLDHKTKILLPQSALKLAYGEAGRNPGARAVVSEDELEVRHRLDSIGLKTSSLRADHSNVKVTSGLKARGTRGEAGHHYGSQMSLERSDSLSLSSPRPGLSRENSGASLGSSSSKVGKSIPRFGIPNSSSSPIASCPSSPGGGTMSKMAQVKAAGNPRALGALNSSKARSLSANSSKGLSSSTKSLASAVTRTTNANLPPSGRTSGPRSPAAVVASKTGRGTIMGTKQAVRAANSRVSELATSGISGKHATVSGDSDSGNDSGVNVGDDKSSIAMLPSPYSKITAPRRPQRYSSGHGSDNSSVLSGELPPAMGRTALFYHSGGSSGYESMIRDSEATGSASSAHDSMSESGISSSGRTRTSKYPKKRATGFQRRRLIPAPLPDTSSLGKKVGTAGQWVDLPPTLKEPFEIKVYEIDDVERLQRGRQEQAGEQSFHDVDKGLLYFNNKLKILERRQQQVRELKAKHEVLMEELEDTKARLMMDPRKWTGEFDLDPNLDKESPEYLDVLERVTEELEFCVNLCKSRVMMVTCFDISTQAGATHEEPREVEV